MRLFEIDFTQYNTKYLSRTGPPKLADPAWYKHINHYCGSYLKTVRHARRPLVRGMSMKEHDEHDAFVSSSRQDRIPSGSSRRGQAQFDNFLRELGVKALRSQSTFTTSSTSLAGMFGKLYLIFPYDGVPFAWSRSEDDIMIHDDELDQYNNAAEFNQAYDIQNTNLGLAMITGHEVWFNGKFVALEYHGNIDYVTQNIINAGKS